MWRRIFNFFRFRRAKRVPVTPWKPTVVDPCKWHYVAAPDGRLKCVTCDIFEGELCKLKRSKARG